MRNEKIENLRRRKLLNDIAFWIIAGTLAIVIIYLFVTGRAFK